MARVTETGDPAKWASLMETWYKEGKPVWMSKGNVHYAVIQNVDGEIEFEPTAEKDFYESSSLS